MTARPYESHDVLLPSNSSSRITRLDELLFLEHRALLSLYEQGTSPPIHALKGDLRGRMLAVPALPKVITALPCAWARTQFFPWRGKSFSRGEQARGHGINRVVSERLKVFPFETFVGPSHHDAKPAVQLDYDLRQNPFFIRAIEDEVREISPGVYLGQAWLRVKGRAHFVLWFALEHRRP